MKRRKNIFPSPDRAPSEPILNLAEHLKALELGLLSIRQERTRPASLRCWPIVFESLAARGVCIQKRTLFVTLQEEAPASLSLVSFEMRVLAEGVALVTYRSSRAQRAAPPSTVLTSSIWIREGENWRMVFH